MMRTGCLTLSLLLVILFCFTGCEKNEPQDPYVPLEPISLTAPYGEDWTLEMTLEDVTPTGAKVVFTHKGDGAHITTGLPYELERFDGSEWVAAEEKNNKVFNLPALFIPNNGQYEMETDWEFHHGVLPAGRYRIGKDVRIEGVRTNEYEGVERTEHYIEDKILYAEFEISPSESKRGIIEYASKKLEEKGIVPKNILDQGDALEFLFDVDSDFERLSADHMRNKWEIHKLLRNNDTFAPFESYCIWYVNDEAERKSGSGQPLPVSRFIAENRSEKPLDMILDEVEALFIDSLFYGYGFECTVEDSDNVKIRLTETDSVHTLFPDLEKAYTVLEGYYNETGLISVSSVEFYDVNGECIAIVCGDVECGVFSVWFDERFDESFEDMGYGPVRTE